MVQIRLTRSLPDTMIVGSCRKWIHFTEYWVGLGQLIWVFVSTELQKCTVTHPCSDNVYSPNMKPHNLTDTDPFQQKTYHPFSNKSMLLIQ